MKTSIFLDTSDLYHRTKRRWKRKLDYHKVLQFFSEEDTQIVSAIAYGIQSEHEATGFMSCLKRAGYITKFRKPEEIVTDSRKIRRPTTNVEMAVDVLSSLSKLDCVILGTGNPEFAPLIKYVVGEGVRCVVFTCNPSPEIKQTANYICEVPECVLECSTV